MTLKTLNQIPAAGKGAAMLLAGCTIFPLPGYAQAQERPNFVIILADDMGYADIGCFGNKAIETPNLDRLAREGMIFTDFHSNGAVSSPTRCALLTGSYQQRSGVENVLLTTSEKDRKAGLDPGRTTFVDVLKARGYNVAMFGKWHLGYEEQFSPVAHGFDEFKGFHAGNVDYKAFLDSQGRPDWWDGDTPADTTGYLTEIINGLGADYIERNDGTPFCLYLAHGCPHSPYQGPDDPAIRQEGTSKTIAGRERKDVDKAYAEMIECLDSGIGRVMDVLKKKGLDKNTMVIFTSDNGPTGPGSAGVLNGKKGSLLEGGHRVPAIFWMPEEIKAGSISEETAMSMDILPTMLDYAGTGYDTCDFDGRSLRPAIGGGHMEDRALFWKSGNSKAVRYGDMKYIEIRKASGTEEMLFDLGKDIAERENIAAKYPEEAARMKTMLEAWEKDVYSWKDSNGPEFVLKTPFTDNVSREMPLPEYPRPQFVRDSWINLNGQWDYKVEPCGFKPVQGLTGAASWTDRPVPENWSGKILVPYAIDSPLSGVGHILRPDEVLWYRREVEIPASWKEGRVLLHFQASDWETSVYVNGRRVGQHRGGYDPFSFDITDYIRDGGNTVCVCAWDATEQQAQALGKQIMPENRKGFRYQPTGGIWQTVWMENVPEESIEKVKLTPLYDAGSVKAEISRSVPGLKVGIAIKDGGRTIAETSTTEDSIEIPVPGFRPWSPQDPHLYDMELTLYGSGGKETDRVKTYFGMRKIEVRPDSDGTPRICLNGQEIFQFGPLDQGYWPDGILTPPSDEAMAYDLEYLKKANINMIRVHIKTHPDRWYYHADRLGILVWQDMICMPKYGQTVTPEASEQWLKEFHGMIDWLYNHPSVTQWIVFNEAWGQHDTERITENIMAYDTTRIVTCASGWNDAPAGDVIDIHDYSFYPRSLPDWKLGGTRASVIGEAGGTNLAVAGHTWYSEKNLPANGGKNGHGSYRQKASFSFTTEGGRHTYSTAGEFEEAYSRYIRTLRWLRAAGGCNATVHTQITDVEHELNGFMTYDRKVSKIPVEKLGEINSALYDKIQVDTVLRWNGRCTEDTGSTFRISGTGGTFCIGIFGTRDCEIYINGELFRKTKIGAGSNEPSYSFYEFFPEDMHLLKKGKNRISIKLLPAKAEGTFVKFSVLKTED